jgi:kumamolisin
MRRSVSAIAIALGAILAGCSGSPPTIASAQPARVQGATDVGAVDGDQVIDFVIALKLRAPVQEINRLLLSQADPGSSQYRRFLTPAEFGARFGATDADFQRVLAWATAHHLTVNRPSQNHTTVSLSGRAADVAQAFGTELRLWRDADGTFRAPSGALAPSGIGDLLGGVVGLDDANHWFSHRVQPTPTPDAAGGTLGPPELTTMYNVPPSAGAGTTVAILGTGYPPSLKEDVDGYITKFALPTKRFAQYTQVFVGGPDRDDDALSNNEYGENLLDVDMALGIAPLANVIHVFTATNAPGLFADGIDFIVNNVPQAHAVSVSFGSCERYAGSEASTLNTLFQQAELEGQEWFFASGDDGTDGCKDGRPNKILAVDWPASSPWVMGVGGTQLTGSTEQAWSAGGGGQSELFDKPIWQSGVGPYASDAVRDVPDIAAMAGNPGVATYAQGQTFASEGTSAATPIWTAIWGLLDAAKGGNGLPSPHATLYQIGQSAGATAFHDITSGNNSAGVTAGFPAQAGYDLATGWGSPDLTNLIANWP